MFGSGLEAYRDLDFPGDYRFNLYLSFIGFQKDFKIELSVAAEAPVRKLYVVIENENQNTDTAVLHDLYGNWQ